MIRTRGPKTALQNRLPAALLALRLAKRTQPAPRPSALAAVGPIQAIQSHPRCGQGVLEVLTRDYA